MYITKSFAWKELNFLSNVLLYSITLSIAKGSFPLLQWQMVKIEKIIQNTKKNNNEFQCNPKVQSETFGVLAHSNTLP